MPTKASPTIKAQGRERGTVGANGADGIDMILILLEGLFGGLWVLDKCLDPEEANPYRAL